jgi:ABC-type dipeptide/oligopeptide/nickel transport system ATPase subunit
VGESGSGKSTVLRAVCGLAPVSGGAVRLKGAPVRTPRPRAFLRQVQMVFQDPYASLHPRHTVDRVLSEPLAIHRLDNREAASSARWRRWAWAAASASATRTSSRAGSASAWPSRAP